MNIKYGSGIENLGYFKHINGINPELPIVLLDAIGKTVATGAKRHKIIQPEIEVDRIIKINGRGAGVDTVGFTAEIVEPPVLITGTAILDKGNNGQNLYARPGNIISWTQGEI